MKKPCWSAIAFGGTLALACAALSAQGRSGVEWTTTGFDAQRTGAVRSDPRISLRTMQTPGEFGAFRFLWKLKLEHDPKAATSLTQPILLDRLIGFRGFKSIAFVATASETVHAIDVDFGTPLWKYHINYSASPPPVPGVTNECPGGLTTALSRPTAIAPAAFGGGRLGGGRGARSGGGVGEPGRGAITLATAGQQRGRGPGAAAAGAAAGRGAPGARGAVPGSAAAAAGVVPGGLPAGARAGGGGPGGGPFVPGADAAYVIGSDGYLHALNVQNGADNMPPASFVPPNTRATGLIIGTMPEGAAIAYTATINGCGSQSDAVWAMELGSDKQGAAAFQPKGATIAGSAGPSLGRDGTVYVTTTAGPSTLSNALIALEPRTLRLKSSVTVAGADFTSSPVVFQWNEKEVVLAAGKGGLFLFDSTALSSGPLATAAASTVGKLNPTALASWQDEQSVRWVAVPAARGIVTFKIAEENGKPAFQQAWVSRDIAAPLAPLVVGGVLFTASSGTSALPSVLSAFDAATGKNVWNSGRTITSRVKGALSAGGGNVYLPGADGTLYAFGFAIEK